jgi:hypothetical protein
VVVVVVRGVGMIGVRGVGVIVSCLKGNGEGSGAKVV